jgi:UV excision repair protein RAD23
MANMRQLIGRNPGMTQMLIQQIASTNPGLFQRLVTSPEEVIRELVQGGELGDEADGDGQLPPGTTVLNVTQEERAAIDRVRLLYLPIKNLNLTLPSAVAGSPWIQSAGGHRSLFCLR